MKKKIIEFRIAHLRIEEWFKYQGEVKNIVQIYLLAILTGIQNIFSRFLALYNEADIALEQLVKSIYTDKIKEADELIKTLTEQNDSFDSLFHERYDEKQIVPSSLIFSRELCFSQSPVLK